VDRDNPEFKAPWNQIRNVPRVFTPDDKVVQIPNSDTPYSTLGLDLRAEPVVITVPSIEKSRYFPVQLIDLYTFNFGYIGSRTTGNDGGSFLVAGPGWKGAQPPGIKKVFRCETEFALAGFRTQLFNPDDRDNVKKVQAGYKAAHSRPTAHITRVFQHSELPLGVLSHQSIGEGPLGAVRQAQHRRGKEL
jgi:hypothetical protein